jgi:hypothetical protein
MSRDAIYQLLSGDSELQSYQAGGIEVMGSARTDSPKRTKVFIVLGYRETPKAFGQVGAQECVVWVHQAKELARSYQLIDQILNRAVEVITSATHVMGNDGWEMSSASWLGNSADLIDESLATLTKNASFRVASRYVTFVAL